MIYDLMLVSRIMRMTDVELDDFIVLLNQYVDKLPTMEQRLKEAVESKDIKSISESLSTIHSSLVKINADDMAEDCLKHINNIKVLTMERIETYVIYLISNMSTLSIDIQMAVYKAQEEVKLEEARKKKLLEEGINEVRADNVNPNESKSPDEPEMLVETEQLSKPEKSDEPEEQEEPEEVVQKIILAVDDSTFFLTTLKTNLQGSPHKLICVNSGVSALNFLSKNTPDLFILDIEMPNMDGYELAEKIRKFGKSAPIIFLTGNADKKYVMKAIQAGAADFIVKPINKDVVLEKIEKYI